MTPHLGVIDLCGNAHIEGDDTGRRLVRPLGDNPAYLS